ncbi:hypothetical protein FOL47_002660 [Perkinsus chesapeaki]|uniref:Folate receptor-like domain-containing protein n=1 Tax=Perkinsus chesapeaki TaxID=330153 RepID=A0A7J6MCA0_PERCH|nr:hypothetical protein FOL47_002660 [Perkinsus chesapeaki]
MKASSRSAIICFILEQLLLGVVMAATAEPGNCSIVASRYGLTDHPKVSVDRSKSSQPLTFCDDYNGNTCCGRLDDLRIRSRYMSLVGRAVGTEEGISEKCADMLRKVACLPCDGYLAVQSKSPMICGSFCDSWFDSCREDFFTVIGGNRLDLCDPKTSLICSRLVDIVSDSAELCERSGLGQALVGQDAEEECFDGEVDPSRVSPVAWREAAEASSFDTVYPWLIGNLKALALACLGLLLLAVKLYAKAARRRSMRKDGDVKDARKEFLERWQQRDKHD